jgi:enoyl-CoA hydratase
VEDVLTCTRADGIATVTLNRPHVRNALSHDLRAQLGETVSELDADASVGAIVLTGAGSAFCAGVDIRELESGTPPPTPIGPLTHPFVTSTTPLIGAVNGAAYTGGLELALACHFLIASERASFADTHARLGLMPGWGLTVLLTDAIGARRARQMSVTCEPVDAHTALSWGLVNRVVDHALLLESCTAIARQACGHPPTAVRRVSALYEAQAATRNAAAWQLEAAAWAGATVAPRHVGQTNVW